MRVSTMRGMGCGLLLAMLAAGCAYQVERFPEVLEPARLAQIRKVTVAPFRYFHDWTGVFRDIYRRSGVRPRPGRKVDRVEATFLPEDAVAAQGYEIVPWPLGLEDFPSKMEAGLARLREKLPQLREAGAEAVLLPSGESLCKDIDSCRARVEILLMDTKDGRILWRGRAQGTTLLSQGDEMQAAVQAALAALPKGRPER